MCNMSPIMWRIIGPTTLSENEISVMETKELLSALKHFFGWKYSF